MALRSIEDIPVQGRRVFLRVDFNVPLRRDRDRVVVADESRIQAVLPTIRHCLKNDARLILASHLGRPKGKRAPEYSLEPVAARLAEILDRDIRLTDEPVGDGARKVVQDLRDGQVAMLENLRFDPGEEANDETFAQTLASYCDVYINDAFGAAHRAHASTTGMVQFVAESGVGFLMQREVEALSALLGKVARPYVAIIGGAKVSDKIEVLDALLARVNSILIGGAMANTFLAAKGKAVGKSLFEEDKLSIARSFLRKASEKRVSIHLPQDVVVAPGLDAPSGRPVSVDDIPADQMALDIGPRTIDDYSAAVRESRTLFWNGPMGVFEKAPFETGTLSIARSVADNTECYSVVGGGDSVAAVVKAGVTDAITHVSTGGGASLEFIQGLTLPGIAVLERSS